MQDKILLAFRKRLKSRGYYDISIYRSYGDDMYTVSCREPLNGTFIQVKHSLIQFNYLMRSKK